MSAEPRPEAVLHDPGSRLPAALEPVVTDPDTPVLLLVAPDTGDAVARSAIALAEARASAGHPTILADASARDPRLHALLDVENTEGLADVFLFGASLDRVRTRPPSRAFDFVPAGAYLPQENAVLASRRWETIAQNLADQGTRLFLFVPAGTPGLGLLSERVGKAVLIGDPRSVDRSAARLDPACEVVAVVEPVDALPPDRLAAEAGEAGGEGSTIFDEPGLAEPVVFRTDRESRRLSPVLLAVLVAAVALGAWYVYARTVAEPAPAAAEAGAPTGVEAREAGRTPEAGETGETGGPGGPGEDGVAGEGGVAGEVPGPGDAGEAVGVPLPVSVAVEAHQSFRTAQERVARLRAAEPGIEFYLAPVAVRDVVYYRLLAGPVSNREAGEALMARLVEAGHKTAADPWAIRPTERAFELGEFATAEAARARVDSLGSAGLPAYVVAVPYASGPDRYRVYGGAYESEGEAAVMRDMLEEAGVDARLVTRTGEPIQDGS